jgi:hypothetical protein
MRHVLNFHPEWGCLVPAPSFMRTARIVVIATAVGATAGGSVVLSLVDRSVGETSVAERTLVQRVQVDSSRVSELRTTQLTLQPLSGSVKASVTQSGGESPLANTNSITLGPSVTLGGREDSVVTGSSTNSMTPDRVTTSAALAVARSIDDMSARTSAVQLPAHKTRHVSEQRARHDRTANLSRSPQYSAHDPGDRTAPHAVQGLLARLAGVILPDSASH